MVKGAIKQSLRVQTPPLGGCWYEYICLKFSGTLLGDPSKYQSFYWGLASNKVVAFRILWAQKLQLQLDDELVKSSPSPSNPSRRRDSTAKPAPNEELSVNCQAEWSFNHSSSCSQRWCIPCNNITRAAAPWAAKWCQFKSRVEVKNRSSDAREPLPSTILIPSSCNSFLSCFF